MKRKRALLESNSPRNIQLGIPRTNRTGGSSGPLAFLVVRLRTAPTAFPSIGEIDFPMPGKLNMMLAAREVVDAGRGRLQIPPAAGSRAPNAKGLSSNIPQ